MRMIYGGQVDPWDFHKVGFTPELLTALLSHYGFGHIRQVASFGMFKDCTELRFANAPISLNMQAIRLDTPPPTNPPWGTTVKGHW